MNSPQYSGEPQETTFSNCDLFRRSLSNRGLSFSFNSEQFWRMYQRSVELLNRLVNKSLLSVTESFVDKHHYFNWEKTCFNAPF